MQVTGRQIGIAAGIATAAIVGDQALKAYVREHNEEATLTNHAGRSGRLPVVWDPTFTDEYATVYVENEGNPIGLGGGDSKRVWPQALGVIATPLIAGAVLYAGATTTGRFAPVAKTAALLGAGLLAGGALSNGVEKIARGKVTDMLFVSRTGVAWNGADVALGAGAALSAVALGARVIQGFR